MGFRLAAVDGRAALIDGDHHYDLARHTDGRLGPDPMDALVHHAELHEIAEGLADDEPDGAVADTTFGLCVPRPEKVFGIGLNYRAHAEETNAKLPTAPLTFTKFPSCLVGPTADIVVRGDTVDWEAELVVVIGQGGRDITEAHAWSAVAGLTAGQDISDRAVQRGGGEPPQFSMGKSFDTYGPIGPMIVSVDQFADPDDLAITCDVDGDRKQEARTSDLIFGVPQLVSWLSAITTLRAGDLIFTGTPSGVGITRGEFLVAGSEVVTTIETIGSLHNRCVAP